MVVSFKLLYFFGARLKMEPLVVLSSLFELKHANGLEPMWARALELFAGKPLTIVNRYKLLPSASRVWYKGIPDIPPPENTVLFKTSYTPSHPADGPQSKILMID